MKLRPAWLVAAGAALALIMAQLPWWAVTWPGVNGQPGGAGDLTGHAGTFGLASVLPAAIGGGLLLTLTLNTVGRRIVAVLLGLLGAGVTVLGVTQPAPAASIVTELWPAAAMAVSHTAQPTWAPWAYAAAGVLSVLGAGWFAMKTGQSRAVGVRRAPSELADSLSSWKAMDEGWDPTADSGGHLPAEGERA